MTDIPAGSPYAQSRTPLFVYLRSAFGAHQRT
jgi:hypothetical protein